ncbi:AMP-binding protein [Paractinoplanes durhamensis]|uniref:AMP-dependent synthetase/ligase domain-containing protein n=1 Tax=Paractinoplanes durhamensis TaxID=113563 RepID=A0ABQ3ZD04_9ACTN|nr:AMP-binding protein [Actinoplanes durhamensis]GIE07713.1 hypothetical protein Adu01nite_90630 [Actinoplanes durhamensis]
MFNLAMLLDGSTRNQPDRTAVVVNPQDWTYADVDAQARRVAALCVERAIAPGDRVALSCPNIQWFPAIYYGILIGVLRFREKRRNFTSPEVYSLIKPPRRVNNGRDHYS